MKIPWYIHGNWKLDSTQLTTLTNDLLEVGVREKNINIVTTYFNKDKDIECLRFLKNFYEDRVNEIAKDQLFYHNSTIRFDFWGQVYHKSDSHHPIHDHFRTNSNTALSFCHFLKPVKNDIFRFSDGEQVEIPRQEEGDLLVFPSYVPHYAAPHNSDKTRVIVAGNISILDHDD